MRNQLRNHSISILQIQHFCCKFDTLKNTKKGGQKASHQTSSVHSPDSIRPAPENHPKTAQKQARPHQMQALESPHFKPLCSLQTAVPYTRLSPARNKRRLLNYSAFSTYRPIPRQPRMEQIRARSAHLFSRQHGVHRRDGAEVPIPLLSPLNRNQQMNMNNLSHTN